MKKNMVRMMMLVIGMVLLTGCGATLQSVSCESTMSLEKGETSLLSVQYTFDKDLDAEQLAVEIGKLAPMFSSSDTAVATVDESGTITALSGGQAVITARVDEDIVTTCTVTVSVPVERVTTPTALDLFINGEDSADISAKVLPSDATDAEIAYTTSDSSVATVDSSGMIQAVSAGECEIVSTAGSQSAATKVTVSVAPTGIAIEGITEGWLYKGGTTTITVQTLPAEAPESAYNFESSDETVATVTANEDGSAIITAVGVGTATITVTSTEGFTATYTLTAKPVPVVSTPSGGSGGNGGSGTGTTTPGTDTPPPSDGGGSPAPSPGNGGSGDPSWTGMYCSICGSATHMEGVCQGVDSPYDPVQPGGDGSDIGWCGD